jgi:hypothetical protein
LGFPRQAEYACVKYHDRDCREGEGDGGINSKLKTLNRARADAPERTINAEIVERERVTRAGPRR